VRRHEPDVYRRIAHVLLPKDYVRLRLSGELWRRIVASTLDLSLEITAADDAAALGAAMLGGVASGLFADVAAAVDSCVRVVGRVDPDPSWRGPYAEGYARFRRLYPAIAGLRATAG
jgi:xylulokinase